MPISTIGANGLGSGAVTNAKIDTMAATKLTGQVPDANAPSGSVIQIVEYTYDGFASTSGTSATLSAVSGAITPSSASSRIWVNYFVTAGTTQYQMTTSWITRNGTKIGANSNTGTSPTGIASAGQGSGYSAGDSATTMTGWFLDSPNTTSSITYAAIIGTRSDFNVTIRTNMATAYSSNNMGFLLPGICRLTLIEIAG